MKFYYRIPQSSPWTLWITEYVKRQRLRRLGFTSDYNTESVLSTDIYNFIDQKIDEIREKERKKNGKR